MKTTMTATRSMTYGTRRLKAGDSFEVTRQHARVLDALGRATYGTRAMVAPEPVPELVDEMTVLRAEYETVLGKRPFMGWDADTLRVKIAEAKG